MSLNILSLTLELTRYYKLFEEPRNYDNLKRVAEFIERDSAGRKIKIENNFSGIQNRQFEDTFSIYLPEYEIKISEEPEIIYSIRDNLTAINFGKERSDRDMQYLSDNNAIELTNIGGYTIFKFPETINEKE